VNTRVASLVALLALTIAPWHLEAGERGPFRRGGGGAGWSNRLSRDFDASSEYGYTADQDALDCTSAFTASAWIRLDSLGTLRSILTKWTYSTSGTFAIETDTAANDELRVFVAASAADAGVNRCTTTDANLAANTWHHVGVYYDGAQGSNAARLVVEVNGVAAACSFSGTIPATLVNSSAQLRVASWSGTLTRLFGPGNIDEVAFWCSTLTGASRAALRSAGRPANLAPLAPLIWWRMGDRDGATSRNHGSATSADLVYVGGGVDDYQPEVP
jgi:hypothetical protein